MGGGAGPAGGRAGLRQGREAGKPGSREAAATAAASAGDLGPQWARQGPAPPRPCAPSRPRRSGAPPATPEPKPERSGIQAGTGAGAEPEREPELEPKLEPAVRRTERSEAAKPSKGRGAGGGAGEGRGGGPGPLPRALLRPRRKHTPGVAQRGPRRIRGALRTGSPLSRGPRPRPPRPRAGHRDSRGPWLPLTMPSGRRDGEVSRFLPDLSPKQTSTPRREHKTVFTTPRPRFRGPLNNPPKKGKLGRTFGQGRRGKGLWALWSLKLEPTPDPRAGKFDPPTGGPPRPCPRFDAYHAGLSQHHRWERWCPRRTFSSSGADFPWRGKRDSRLSPRRLLWLAAQRQAVQPPLPNRSRKLGSAHQTHGRLVRPSPSPHRPDSPEAGARRTQGCPPDPTRRASGDGQARAGKGRAPVTGVSSGGSRSLVLGLNSHSPRAPALSKPLLTLLKHPDCSTGTSGFTSLCLSCLC